MGLGQVMFVCVTMPTRAWAWYPAIRNGFTRHRGSFVFRDEGVLYAGASGFCMRGWLFGGLNFERGDSIVEFLLTVVCQLVVKCPGGYGGCRRGVTGTMWRRVENGS